MTSHVCEVKQSEELTISARCSCGNYIHMTASPETRRVTKQTLSGLCPATDLAYRRVRRASLA